MSEEFKFSDPGEGLQEAEILEVHVSAGDSVEDGDTVLTVETDKASTEVPAPFTGTVDEVRVQEEDVVEVGDVLLTYTDAEAEESSEQESEEGESSGGEASESEARESSGEQASEGEEAQESETSESSEQREQESAARSRASSGEPVPAAPSTRRLAREKGIDLHDVEPSGKKGRITAEDVEAAASSQGGGKSRGGRRQAAADGGSQLIPGGAPQPNMPDFTQWGETEREGLATIRRATAQNMARSWEQIPHVFHQDIADVTELDRFRRAHADAAEDEGGKLTLTVLVMKALVGVLREFPRFNASLDAENEEIIYKRYFNIGLAVATDHGLLVPVIRDVDQKDLIQLAVETVDKARRTRDGDIQGQEMMGGCISLTNPGPMGGSSLTPLINYPQVAILGMGKARLDPVVTGDMDNPKIAPRLHLPLILGFDHRVNDGADAAQFVTTLMNRLKDPESLLLRV